MSNEITHNAATGLTFYACRFQQNGNVFLSDGASDEVWGTAGRTAADYDVPMTEEDACGHYKGDFDALANIAAGAYPVVVYLQSGGGPVDADVSVSQGEIDWDGSAELNIVTLTDQIAALNDPTVAAIADAVHDEVVEGTITLRQAMRLMLAVLTAKASGGGTTSITFRDIGDTKDRIIATVDADGNRTAIGTRDGT
jgi:hypothetical protein